MINNTTQPLSNEEAIDLIEECLTNAKFRVIDSLRLRVHLLSQTQFLVPIFPTHELFKEAIMYELEKLLKSKNGIPEDVPYKDCFESLHLLFIHPRHGKLGLFIRKYHLTIGILAALASLIFK